jgi:segregation and condensation protein B
MDVDAIGRRPRPKDLDADLATLAPELRWREWMGRVEAVIFASKEPVSREVLARVVGPQCNLDLVIADIRAELHGRPYDLVAVAGGWHHRTRRQFADAIQLAMGAPHAKPLSRTESLVLTAIAYFRPITRGELSQLFGKEVSRDIIGQLRALYFIAAGPRGPAPRIPTSPPSNSCRTSASIRSATSPTWSSSRRPVCSANRSCSPARL